MGIFKAIQAFAHKREIRESKDEILFGEVIRLMVKNYGPLVQIETSPIGDYKQARFRIFKNELLYSVTIKVNRWTGGSAIGEALIGSKGSLTLVAEVKNYVADPDDILNMWKTDFKNITKIPLLGGIKINHQMNSILATKTRVVDMGDFVNNMWGERKILEQDLKDDILELCKQLEPFRKKK